MLELVFALALVLMLALIQSHVVPLRCAFFVAFVSRKLKILPLCFGRQLRLNGATQNVDLASPVVTHRVAAFWAILLKISLS